MQLTTYAMQLLWVGALVAANPGWCVHVCVCVSMYSYAVAVAHTRS